MVRTHLIMHYIYVTSNARKIGGFRAYLIKAGLFMYSNHDDFKYLLPTSERLRLRSLRLLFLYPTGTFHFSRIKR